jgi:DNA-binding IclR family transcriptional regulator
VTLMKSPGEGDIGSPRVASVKSALRTLEILEALSVSASNMSVATLSRQLKIPKSSLHGILRTMVAHGWLETDATGTLYRLGLRAFLTGSAYVGSDDIVTLTQIALDSLSEKFGETVHLGRLDGPNIIYLAKRESAHALRLYSAVGRRLPAHATALGKSLLAQLSDEEVDRRLTWPLAALTSQTITDPAALRSELARIRERGYSIDDGENAEGIMCVAVALRPSRGSYNAVSCSVPQGRMTDGRLAEIASALRSSADMVNLLVGRAGTDSR